MKKLETFLKSVENIKTQAKSEIDSRDTRAEVTALRVKYLGKSTGVLGKTLKTFIPENSNEESLSKHAIKKAHKEIETAVTTKIIEITKAEDD